MVGHSLHTSQSGSLSGLFLISGLLSSLTLLISMAKLAYARWTGAEDADAVQTAGTNPSNDQYRPLESTADNISVPHPEATNGDHQGGHGSGAGVGHRFPLDEECGASAGAVHDGSVPARAQSLKMIEMNIV